MFKIQIEYIWMFAREYLVNGYGYGKKMLLLTRRKWHILIRLAYLHLMILAHSKGQGQDHAHLILARSQGQGQDDAHVDNEHL